MIVCEWLWLPWNWQVIAPDPYLSLYMCILSVIVCAVSANVCVCMSDNMLKNAHFNSNPNRDLSGATKRGRKRMIEMDVAIFLSYLALVRVWKNKWYFSFQLYYIALAPPHPRRSQHTRKLNMYITMDTSLIITRGLAHWKSTNTIIRVPWRVLLLRSHVFPARPDLGLTYTYKDDFPSLA